MPTLTIELTEAAYEDALAFPEQERVRIAANAFATARNEIRQSAQFEEDEPTSEEDLTAIGEAIADLEAGRLVDGDTFFKGLEEKHGWKL